MINVISQSLELDVVNINAYAKFYQNIPDGLRVIYIFHEQAGDKIFTNCPCQNQMFDYRAHDESQSSVSVDFLSTPEPLYNTVRYNTILDTTRIWVGPQMATFYTFFYITYIFYSRYNTDWIANTEIGLDPNNSVIKRLWCMSISNELRG